MKVPGEVYTEHARHGVAQLHRRVSLDQESLARGLPQSEMAGRVRPEPAPPALQADRGATPGAFVRGLG